MRFEPGLGCKCTLAIMRAPVFVLVLAACLLCLGTTASAQLPGLDTSEAPPPEVQAAIDRAQPLLDQAAEAIRANQDDRASELTGRALLQILQQIGMGHPWARRVPAYIGNSLIQTKMRALSSPERTPDSGADNSGMSPEFQRHLFSGGIQRDFEKLAAGGRAAVAGRIDEAVELFSTGLLGMERMFELALIQATRSEDHASSNFKLKALTNMLELGVHSAITLAVENPEHPGALELAAGITATRLERDQRLERDLISAVWARVGTGRRAEYDEFQGQRAELASLQFAGAAGAALGSELEKRIQELKQVITVTRRNLAMELESEREQRKQLQLDEAVLALRSALEPRQRFVQYVRYRIFDFKGNRGWENRLGPAHYAAFVLGAQPGQLAVFELGDAGEIDAAVTAFLGRVRSPNEPLSRIEASANVLYGKILAPLAAQLPESAEVVLSLDGSLNLVPFAALHDGKAWMLDRYSFRYVTTAQDLLRNPVTGASGPPVLVGDPNYEPYSAHLLSRSALLDGISFAPLPGTRAEVTMLQELFPTAQLVLGDEATAQHVAGLRSPTILHIATHGVFLDDSGGTTGARGLVRIRPPAGGAAPQAKQAEMSESLKPAREPAREWKIVPTLMRSALVLSPRGKTDGLLTAYEVEGMDLRRTQLVVLSACDTGRGEVPTHQGVQGFRRSFLVAGAETLVTSLWQVSDESTVALMTGYYRRLLSGEGRVAAMDGSMRELRTRHESPYFWAPFIVVGSAEPLSDAKSLGRRASLPR